MRNRPDGFDIYLVNVKTIRTIAHIFVFFSEKPNFTELLRRCSRKKNMRMNENNKTNKYLLEKNGFTAKHENNPSENFSKGSS